MRSSFVVDISSASRRFHSARISALGAQPRMPGWMRPGKRRWGIWRDEQKMPSKSHIAFALGWREGLAVNSNERNKKGESSSGIDLRFGVYLVKESSAVVFVKYACEAPWLLLERLNVLDLDNEDVSWLCGLNFEWTRKVVDLG